MYRPGVACWCRSNYGLGFFGRFDDVFGLTRCQSLIALHRAIANRWRREAISAIDDNDVEHSFISQCSESSRHAGRPSATLTLIGHRAHVYAIGSTSMENRRRVTFELPLLGQLENFDIVRDRALADNPLSPNTVMMSSVQSSRLVHACPTVTFSLSLSLSVCVCNPRQ